MSNVDENEKSRSTLTKSMRNGMEKYFFEKRNAGE